ncbi:hypothetical protein [Pseudomonas sihuiensis]|uniref:Uncharacterized protein n=1 Tax=Pseudomonas sihuiensis TaxID=1274359 RepID=A0A1H2L3A7_9PSED|nr:hypothetical protein [Pseudomonas sihuiensis]SDU75480.1 hypothetical protein SAMN05216363_0041 [Pseudomonas sihuiensis]SDU82085.1 hypothetical protein SAMN05216363_1867 [Pseudomonas sihuiensis]
MAYYTGSANDMAAVRSALVDACVAEGWAWNEVTEVLSKGAMFLRLQVVSGYLSLLGRTSAASGDAPNVVRLGQIGSVPIVFPLTYEVFAFESEVYLVCRYSIDFYQWCAFGNSTIQGLPGSGMWLGASIGSLAADGGIRIDPESSNNGASHTTGALFWYTQNNGLSNRNSFVHSDLDGQGWALSQTLGASYVGPGPLAPLISVLPSRWNSEAVLLPLRSWKVRPSSKLSLTSELEHARYTRIDNYVPGEVVSIGPDRWKVFPWYRKDTSARNGGNNIDHTGTFGWAIRYEGP